MAALKTHGPTPESRIRSIYKQSLLKTVFYQCRKGRWGDNNGRRRKKNKSYDSRFISYVNKWSFLLAVDSDLRSPIEIIAEKKRSRNDVLKRCGACRSGLGSLHAWQAAQFMILQLLSLYLLLHYRRRTGMLRQLFYEEIRIERDSDLTLFLRKKNIYKILKIL